jgi:hypothetical protein
VARASVTRRAEAVARPRPKSAGPGRAATRRSPVAAPVPITPPRSARPPRSRTQSGSVAAPPSPQTTAGSAPAGARFRSGVAHRAHSPGDDLAGRGREIGAHDDLSVLGAPGSGSLNGCDVAGDPCHVEHYERLPGLRLHALVVRLGAGAQVAEHVVARGDVLEVDLAGFVGMTSGFTSSHHPGATRSASMPGLPPHWRQAIGLDASPATTQARAAPLRYPPRHHPGASRSASMPALPPYRRDLPRFDASPATTQARAAPLRCPPRHHACASRSASMPAPTRPRSGALRFHSRPAAMRWALRAPPPTPRTRSPGATTVRPVTWLTDQTGHMVYTSRAHRVIDRAPGWRGPGGPRREPGDPPPQTYAG